MRNNSTNLMQNSKSFLGMSIGTRRSYLMKKTGDKQSSANYPLMAEYFLFSAVIDRV
jgi:hypothetical protein